MIFKDIAWMRSCLALAPIWERCSRRQYFAIIVAPNGRVAGMGYNGAPPGVGNCTDGYCPRAASDAAHGSTYSDCTAVHAEANALIWSDMTARQGGTLYVNGPPCWGCAKQIAGSGVRRVVYLADDAYADSPRVLALLEEAGVTALELDLGDL